MPQQFSNTAFWARVTKTSDCWLWTGALDRDGYGRLKCGGVDLRVHVFMYERAVGVIPRGLCVLHRCDVRNCCNPAHLFLGTNADNTADRDAKGRQARGERHWRAKMTWSEVRAARERYATGVVSLRELCAEYGLERSSMRDMLTGKTWKEEAPH